MAKQGTTRLRVLQALDRLGDSTQINLNSFSIGLGLRKGTLTYYLNDLRDSGVIRTSPVFGGTAIQILDREALRRRIEALSLDQGGNGRSGGPTGRLAVKARSGAGRPASVYGDRLA